MCRCTRPARQPGGELLADRLHAGGGQADPAADEAAPQQVEVAAGGLQPVLQQHAGQERAEEALQAGLADARRPQRLLGGPLGRRSSRPTGQ